MLGGPLVRCCAGCQKSLKPLFCLFIVKQFIRISTVLWYIQKHLMETKMLLNTICVVLLKLVLTESPNNVPKPVFITFNSRHSC